LLIRALLTSIVNVLPCFGGSVVGWVIGGRGSRSICSGLWDGAVATVLSSFGIYGRSCARFGSRGGGDLICSVVSLPALFFVDPSFVRNNMSSILIGS